MHSLTKNQSNTSGCMKEEQLRKGDTQMVEFDVMVALVPLWAERNRY